MGEIADRLDRLVIPVHSPDRRIVARISGRGRLADVEISPHAFHHYRRTELAHQLGQLGRLAFVAYRRERRQVVDSVLAAPIRDDLTDVVGPRLRQYRRGLAELVAAGDSGNGEVRVSARGLADWAVTIADLPHQVTTERFVGWLRTAVAGLLADHARLAGALRDEIYGPAERAAAPRPGRLTIER